ncbi:MAG: FMN-binding protein [Pseudomonadota bacterium]
MPESRETPPHVNGIDSRLARFRGRSIFEPLSSEIDGITGATITARAVVEIINSTGNRMKAIRFRLIKLPGRVLNRARMLRVRLVGGAWVERNTL